MEKTTQNRPEFELNNLVKETYNKIAEWHNENPNSNSLKELSFEIVSDVIKESYLYLGLNVDFDLKVDEATRQKMNSIKNQKDESGKSKNANELTDEELFLEIQRRKAIKGN